MDMVLSLFSGSVGAGLMSIILAVLQRRWAKKDKKSSQLAALVEAQKVLMIDRVRHLGSVYIRQGEISLEDKENLHQMYAAYKSLGGNGHLDLVMGEVDRLLVKGE